MSQGLCPCPLFFSELVSFLTKRLLVRKIQTCWNQNSSRGRISFDETLLRKHFSIPGWNFKRVSRAWWLGDSPACGRPGFKSLFEIRFQSLLKISWSSSLKLGLPHPSESPKPPGCSAVGLSVFFQPDWENSGNLKLLWDRKTISRPALVLSIMWSYRLLSRVKEWEQGHEVVSYFL